MCHQSVVLHPEHHVSRYQPTVVTLSLPSVCLLAHHTLWVLPHKEPHSFPSGFPLLAVAWKGDLENSQNYKTQGGSLEGVGQGDQLPREHFMQNAKLT